MPRKVTRRKPKRKTQRRKKATVQQLVKKIVNDSNELKKKGFSKEEILYLVAFGVGGLALVTGLGLGGVALSRKMREEREREAAEERAEPGILQLQALFRRKREAARKKREKEEALKYFAEPGISKLQALFRKRRKRKKMLEVLKYPVLQNILVLLLFLFFFLLLLFFF
jgi:hypothetical protein